MNEGKDDLKSRLETLLDRKKEKFVKIENIYYDDEKKNRNRNSIMLPIAV